MNAVLLSVALSSLWLLCTSLDVPVQPNFFWKKLAGKWYPAIMVKQYPSERAVYAYTIQPLSNGDIVLKVEIPRDGVCRLKRVVLYAVRNGVFETEDGKSQFYVVETDYDTYHISYIKMEDETFLHLYTREQAYSEEAKERFLVAVQSLMFNSEQLFYLNPNDICTTPLEGT